MNRAVFVLFLLVANAAVIPSKRTPVEEEQRERKVAQVSNVPRSTLAEPETCVTL